MPKPSIRAIQRLYAMSGNRCAFSGCTALIIEDSPGMAGINMGEICHIRASKAGGERYDPDQTDVERHGYENLILLCRRHHKLIDSDTIEFSVVATTQARDWRAVRVSACRPIPWKRR